MERNHSHEHKEKTYTCPMHPEVTGEKGDKCPKCGMGLVAVHQDNAVQVKLTTSPQNIEAGLPTELSFAIQENDKIVPLDISHEMKYHIMVISEDLTWFRHLHPEEQADGTYALKEVFPYRGKYLLFSDFKPTGGVAKLDKQEIEVKGKQNTSDEGTPTKLTSTVEGYTVTLENGEDLRTNHNQPLEISVKKNGEKLDEGDLEQYLGASAHIVMVNKADKDYLHIHPVSHSRFPIFAESFIEKTGIYRIWVQFQIQDEVLTADFTVNVAKGEKKRKVMAMGTIMGIHTKTRK